jgi:carbon storage regulator
MLVLSRKPNEAIIINGNIRVMVVGIRGNHVRLGIEAPDSVAIFREELCDWNGVNAEPAEPVRAGVPSPQTVM